MSIVKRILLAGHLAVAPCADTQPFQGTAFISPNRSTVADPSVPVAVEHTGRVMEGGALQSLEFEGRAVLQTGLDVRDRCRNGKLTRHGLASLRGRLEARLGRLIDAPPPLKDAKRFAKHLANEFLAVFLFLRDPSIDPTNWRAEQAIRPAVVIRKVCGGNRARKGADTQQVLSSVVRTTRQLTTA